MRRAVVGAGVALMVAVGCHAWHSVPQTAPAPTTVTHPLRVTINQGARRLRLERATVRSDSVIGIVIEAEDRRGGEWVPDRSRPLGQTVAIAAADVSSLEKFTTSWTRTTVLIAVIAGVLVLAAYGALAAAMSDPNY